MLLTLTWAAERGLELGPLFLRYYQVLFFAGFLLGFYLMRRYFQKEGVSQEVLDNLLIYTVVATIIGARLGHVFFYDWAYYKQHVAEIFMPWKGGLASHGAAVIIPLTLYYFIQKLCIRSSGIRKSMPISGSMCLRHIMPCWTSRSDSASSKR